MVETPAGGLVQLTQRETMSLEINSLSDLRLKWALPMLKEAQKRFNKYPNANNWRDCTRAMLVYQQLDYAAVSHRIDTAKLWKELLTRPMGEWEDAICRATVGLTCAEALA